MLLQDVAKRMACARLFSTIDLFSPPKGLCCRYSMLEMDEDEEDPYKELNDLFVDFKDIWIYIDNVADRINNIFFGSDSESESDED